MTPDTVSIADILRRQFRPTLDMLERAIDSCPDEVWDARDDGHAFWQEAYHALIGLHFWLRRPGEGFQPAPFHSEEAANLGDVAGPGVTREQIDAYRRDVYARCDAVLEGLTSAGAVEAEEMRGRKLTLADRLLTQVRHVQHHVGCMHSTLRRRTGATPDWVGFGE